MSEDAEASPDSEHPSQDNDQQQTIEIPLAAVPDAKANETITLKVISIDSEVGIVNAVAVKAPAEGPGGTAGMASEFDQPK